MAVLVTVILLIYVIPVVSDMFNSFGKELPLPPQIAMNVGYVTIAYFWYIIAGLVSAVLGIRTYYRTEHGQEVIDRLLLRLPIFGGIFRKRAAARFTRTLSTLISSGVPILDALAITGKTAGNKAVENGVFAARQSITEGWTLTDPLVESKAFQPMVCRMINVGETTSAACVSLPSCPSPQDH